MSRQRRRRNQWRRYGLCCTASRGLACVPCNSCDGRVIHGLVGQGEQTSYLIEFTKIDGTVTTVFAYLLFSFVSSEIEREGIPFPSPPFPPSALRCPRSSRYLRRTAGNLSQLNADHAVVPNNAYQFHSSAGLILTQTLKLRRPTRRDVGEGHKAFFTAGLSVSINSSQPRCSTRGEQLYRRTDS